MTDKRKIYVYSEELYPYYGSEFESFYVDNPDILEDVERNVEVTDDEYELIKRTFKDFEAVQNLLSERLKQCVVIEGGKGT